MSRFILALSLVAALLLPLSLAPGAAATGSSWCAGKHAERRVDHARCGGGAGSVAQPGASGPPVAEAPRIVRPVRDATTFTWSGHEWTKRSNPGAPTYNGQWSTDNVVPRGDTVLLAVTNPTGSSPVAGELRSTRTGWGYGTYTAVVSGDFTGMGQSVVMGNLFTYDFTQGPGASANEIDAGEISAWGMPDEPKTVSTSHWVDGGPTNVMGIVKELHVTGPTTMTFQLEWVPGRITYRVFHGAGTAGPVFGTKVVTRDVPVPANEQVVFNAWVTGANPDDEAVTRPFVATLHSFDFAPLR